MEIFRQIWLKVTMFLLASFVARNVEISMFRATKLVNLRNIKILRLSLLKGIVARKIEISMFLRKSLLKGFVARNVEISMFLATKLVNLRNMKILLSFA